MPTYFKPLRRKIGVVTLMLACVFAAGWLRSVAVEDVVVVHADKSVARGRVTLQRYRVISGRGLLGLIVDHYGIGLVTPDSQKVINETYSRFEKEMFNWASSPKSQSRDRWFWEANDLNVIFYGTHQTNYESGKWHTCTVLPYQSIVISLTLLSALLLLSKPRKSAAPKPVP